jgi:hypothetical protein
MTGGGAGNRFSVGVFLPGVAPRSLREGEDGAPKFACAAVACVGKADAHCGGVWSPSPPTHLPLAGEGRKSKQ